MEGAEERAREAARRDGLSVYCHYRGEDWYRLKRSASEEWMEQVREIGGEQAYEKMRRAMEKADQEKARQVEKSLKFPALKRPERRGPERSGPERDFGPAARSFSRCVRACFYAVFCLRGVGRMVLTSWEKV